MGEKELTGIYFCQLSNGHPDTLNIAELAEYAKGFEGVPVVWHSGDFLLSDADHLAARIKENNLSRIVIAGDTPGMVKTQCLTRPFRPLTVQPVSSHQKWLKWGSTPTLN